MTATRRQVEVLVDDRLAGWLEIAGDDELPGEDVVFSYDDDWISSPSGFDLSPELPRRRGPQRPTLGRQMFGSFEDASPDTWGRKLLFDRLRQQARQAGQRIPQLTPGRTLLLVNDATRQGALRFREGGQFLSDWGQRADLRDVAHLAAAAQRFLDTGHVEPEDQLLIGAGSSPGGARPKAWVRDENGTMLLAKFPMTADVGDVLLWEMVAHRLQHRAGIRVQPAWLMPLNQGAHIFLTVRFDRDGEQRVPFMSMRTALQVTGHEHIDYATMAREIARISADPVADAHEIFSRAALNAMVSNIDDHMRNHALLHTRRGWRLSPAFDVNPARFGHSDTPLTRTGDVVDRDVRELVEAADDFRLTRQEAVQRLHTVAQATAHWADEALSLGADPEEVRTWAAAFEGPNRERIDFLHAATRSMIDLGGGHPDDVPHDATSRSANDSYDDGHVWVPEHVRGERRIPGHYRRRPRRR